MWVGLEQGVGRRGDEGIPSVEENRPENIEGR